MTFSEQINRYLAALDCPASRLARVTGIPPYAISKYRSGTRRPERNSETVNRLAEGIRTIAQEKGSRQVLEDDIAARLNAALLSETESFDFSVMTKNLRLIVNELGISLSEISEITSFSRSTLYSMWTGRSRLRDPESFVRALSQHIVDRFGDMNGQMKVSKLIGWPDSLFDMKASYFEAVVSWLSGELETEQAVSEKKTRVGEEFDLNHYQKEKKYVAKLLSKMSVNFAKVREYVGMKGMKSGIADFIRATAMSRTYKRMILYSDFPLDPLFDETDEMNMWTEGLTLALRKGLHVQSVHCMDRPADEITKGLRAWIPLFMSGLITPMYLEQKRNCFHNFILASGGAVLRGSSMADNYDDAFFQMFTGKETVEREYRLAEQLVSRAKPLMETYMAADGEKLKKMLLTEGQRAGRKDLLLSSPPACTINEELLSQMLKRNPVGEESARRIRTFIEEGKGIMKRLDEGGEVNLNLVYLTKHEFDLHPPRLNLAGTEMFYTYEEYRTHLNETRRFTETQKKYCFAINNTAHFRNIQIAVLGEKRALLAKKTYPEMYLLVKHPVWCSALRKISASG